MDNSRIFNAFALTARMEMPSYTQGAAALSLGYVLLRLQRVLITPWVNQKQFHFGYIKLYTIDS